MNQTDISLKLAEIALDKEKTELLSDFVKIGIPSLIALVGLVSTFLLTKSGYKKDLLIQKIKNTHDSKKEIKERTGQLISNITINLTELHSNMIKYSSLLSAKLEVEHDGEHFPDDKRHELSQNYQELLMSLHTMFEVEAEIYLLGEKEVQKAFTDYQVKLLELHSNYQPSFNPALRDQLIDITADIRDLRENLFKLLSSSYLS